MQSSDPNAFPPPASKTVPTPVLRTRRTNATTQQRLLQCIITIIIIMAIFIPLTLNLLVVSWAAGMEPCSRLQI